MSLTVQSSRCAILDASYRPFSSVASLKIPRFVERGRSLCVQSGHRSVSDEVWRLPLSLRSAYCHRLSRSNAYRQHLESMRNYRGVHPRGVEKIRSASRTNERSKHESSGRIVSGAVLRSRPSEGHRQRSAILLRMQRRLVQSHLPTIGKTRAQCTPLWRCARLNRLAACTSSQGEVRNAAVLCDACDGRVFKANRRS